MDLAGRQFQLFLIDSGNPGALTLEMTRLNFLVGGYENNGQRIPQRRIHI